MRGILSLAHGAAIRRIERDFRGLGYRVQIQLFNTADFGVPQTRWRVIIAGTRGDLPVEEDYRYPKPTHARLPRGAVTRSRGERLRPWVTISEALRRIPDPSGKDRLPNHIYSQYKLAFRTLSHRPPEDQP